MGGSYRIKLKRHSKSGVLVIPLGLPAGSSTKNDLIIICETSQRMIFNLGRDKLLVLHD
jgi:hypothetical protein